MVACIWLRRWRIWLPACVVQIVISLPVLIGATSFAQNPIASADRMPALLMSKGDYTAGDTALAAVRDTEPIIMSLWPGSGTRDDDPGADLKEELPQRPDGLVRIARVSRPTLHLWKPQKPDGRAMIVFPGGAYNGLAAEHEGTQIAAWLNQQGVTAFVTKYRVPRREGLQKHAVALQDAQRAICLVRSQADHFGIDPQQIGVIGFSAGGHLATMTIHHASVSSYEAIDAFDNASARPDFAILIYPAYLTATRDGSELDSQIKQLPSRNDYPPIFSAVAADDVFAPSALRYMLHLQQAKVSGELHVYTKGGHGKGLRDVGYPFSEWTKPCARWLADLQNSTKRGNVKQQQQSSSR